MEDFARVREREREGETERWKGTREGEWPGRVVADGWIGDVHPDATSIQKSVKGVQRWSRRKASVVFVQRADQCQRQVKSSEEGEDVAGMWWLALPGAGVCDKTSV